MRVCPPTRIISSISDTLKGEASTARLVISIDRSMYGRASSSSTERVIFRSKCFGPSASLVTNGMFISVSVAVDSSCFAFSAASSSRCRASGSFVRSMPLSFLNSSAIHRMIFWSISFPPIRLSPSVDFTSIVSPEISRTETSNVPPPKSKTTICSSFFLLNP